jgi:NhaP-type Na+/H+ or K+/H+ antiporter
MNFIIVLTLAVVLVAVAFAGLAIKILTEKKGEFPNLHIGANPHMKERGITCAQTFDKIEQAKARRELSFKELSFMKEEPGSC